MKTRKSRGLLASYSRRRRTRGCGGREEGGEGLGRVPGTGTRANPRRRRRVHHYRGDRSCCYCCCSAARVLSRFGRLKYSMASRSRLGMQISSGESHVPAPGLILYPDSVPASPRFPPSHFLCRALSIYSFSYPPPPSPPSSQRLVSLDGSSFHLNVHQCFSSVTF